MLARVIRCADCGAAYVLRVGISLDTGENRYLLSRDCKCKARQWRVSDDLANVDDGLFNTDAEVIT